jgi:hypothetical protein
VTRGAGGLILELPEDVVERIAVCAAELVAERAERRADDGFRVSLCRRAR